MSTLILVGIYVIVSTAAIAFGGVEQLAGDQSGDVLGLLAGEVFGSTLLGKIVIVAVLTSAAASTQTTILPTSRTALSMARAKAAPAALGRIHGRYLTPHVATWIMGGLSIAWYVGLTAGQPEHAVRLDRRARPDDRLLLRADRASPAPGTTAARSRRACAGSCSSASRRSLGGATLLCVFVRSCIDLGRADAGSTTYFGIGSPLVIGARLPADGGGADGDVAAPTSRIADRKLGCGVTGVGLDLSLGFFPRPYPCGLSAWVSARQ